MQEKNISKFDFEQCQKCAICTTVCPMMTVNPEYPGPKQSGPDFERHRLKFPGDWDAAIKYCLNCKRCEVACPSGVKVADIIATAKLQRPHSKNRLRDWTLANTDFMGTLASPFAPIINPILGTSPVKALMHAVMGVDKRRVFPKYSSEKFTSWFKSTACPSQEGFKRHVSYFHGCYVNYNYPQLGKDLVKVMNACGYGVRLLDKEKCCGVALMANGFKNKAVANARLNSKYIATALEGTSDAVLTSSSSCTFTMRDEYPGILGVPAADVMLATRFLYEKISSGEIKLAFKKGWKMKAAYHTACHMQRMGWQVFSIELLKLIPGLELTVLDQECCGIAGTFGFKKEYYDFSQKIGSKLFGKIRESGAEYVITDCETCKWQIEMSTGLPVLNPISILADAIDTEKTKL